MGHLSSDRHLDEEIVSGLVATQFPDLGGQAVSRLGGGWDHELFCVGGEWVFRFPRRAERVPWLAREIQITALAAETLSALRAPGALGSLGAMGSLGAGVPVFERIGEPSAAFAYRHRRDAERTAPRRSFTRAPHPGRLGTRTVG